MHRRPTRARRGVRAILPALLVVAAALAGCVHTHGDDTPPIWDGVVVRIPVGAFDPAHGGDWYEPSVHLVTAPATIMWINDDLAYHRVLGFWVAEPVPAWAAMGGDGHDHDNDDDGHDHGSMGIQAFDIWLDVGESLVMGLDGDGLLQLHCHPHPWMEDTLDVRPAEAQDYEVATHQLVVAGRSQGETDEGETAERTWLLDAPNLVSVAAVLRWDDGEDDLVGLSDLNPPDTLRLLLVDPLGTMVAQEARSARHGEIRIHHDAWQPAWPDAVHAHGAAAAREALAERHPETFDASGAWTLRVIVEEAPGLVPADGTPGRDGRQTWTLDVEARHAWAGLAPAAQSEHRVARGAQEDP